MKSNYRVLVIVALMFGGVVFIPFLVPTGTDTQILTSPMSGVELFDNPVLSNNASGWDFGSWRFAGQSPHPSSFVFEDGKVTMGLEGNDTSFYCIEMVQHKNVALDLSTNDYHVGWTGTLLNAEVDVGGVVGFGVNLWLDVVFSNGTTEELELLVFFYQNGFYSIPVGSFKDYGYRGSYWFERLVDSPSRESGTWRFFYFHPIQLDFGERREITFSLSEALRIVVGETGYGDAGFSVKTVTCVLELYRGRGSFSVERLSLKRII